LVRADSKGYFRREERLIQPGIFDRGEDMESLLVTGEFMELTDVTRNTLIHYDNIGLLKPVMTNKRGDRFYHPFQAYTMSLIQNFQAAGMSLDSIKKAFSGADDGSGVIDVYKNNREEIKKASEALHEQYRESVRAYRYIEKTADVAKFFNKYDPEGDPVLTSVNIQGSCKMTFFDGRLSMIGKAYYDQVSAHIKNTYGKLRDGTFPIVTHFAKDDFMNGNDYAYAISTYTLYKGNRSFDDLSKLDCVIMRRNGDAKQLPFAMQKIREFMVKNNLVLADNLVIMTNVFNVDGQGKRFADRLIVAPVVKNDGTQTVKFNENLEEKLAAYEKNQADIDELLSSGEFIKMCGITRNTLNFYEKNNLIQPAVVKDNGYKLYGVSQIFRYISIKGLKQAGFSIDEIKHQITYKDGMYAIDTTHDEFVEKQKKLIRENIDKYVTKILAMKNICGWLSEFAKIEDKISVDVVLDKNWFYRPIPYEKDNKGSTRGIRHELVRTVKRAKHNPDIIPYPVGAVLSRDLDPEKDSSMVLIHPGKARHGDRKMDGLYRVFSMRADGLNFREKIKAFADGINNEGIYKIRGDIISVFYSIEKRVTEQVNLDEMTLVCAVIFPLQKR
jgi:DNA-binding transcriptional MerR regulator